MTYRDELRALGNDAQQLEQLYQAAHKAGAATAFRQAIAEEHTAAPENLLYAAWFYRLQQAAAQAAGRAVAWGWVVPLAVLNGLLLWALSGDRFMLAIANAPYNLANDFLPGVVLLAAPLSAALILLYFTVVGRRKWQHSAPVGLALLAAAAYVLLVYPQAGTRPFQEQYLSLMALHLPLLAWAGVGLFLTIDRRDAANRFAFLMRSLELFIMGGLFVIAGGLFTAITAGLFAALNIEFPELAQRLFIAGGGGLIPVLATAVLYDPTRPPAEQAFDEGLSRLVALLMRILLPLTLLVLIVYLGFIPFNFRAAFDNRDVLIVFSAMLFAVIALLLGATPLRPTDLSPQLGRWLRRGIVGAAAAALVVSLYALAAIVYRTALDRPTPNRIAFIGWNIINSGLLCLLLIRQRRSPAAAWTDALQRTFSAGALAYTVWTAVVILALPWLFHNSLGQVSALPPAVQAIVFDNPQPILLKCSNSPHIYLLDGGQKRWIRDIATFEARGYTWRDVRFLSCADLRIVPDGAPIPADAGPPPQP